MLQVKNLVKRYTAKGETVTALNGVSVDFPARGMVFLLGKSGSGKSTLLNVSGGLDVPDEGEVIVNGKSSKDFSPGDFDSYRNTYLGFIFQEYNILSELTVEENVALALELQGKPKDRTRVAEILRQVDLEGYGDRRPNTLSGGQKQRVAIARALVKDPEIIMADEPTGALDSTTGAQVFDTLKKLSQSKLVVVVSHDREFAEVYADRIIELKDGNIISDMTRTDGAQSFVRTNLNEVTDKKISLLSGADMTAEEEQKVLAFVRKHKGGLVISAEDEDLAVSPKETQTGAFRETDLAAIPKEEPGDCRFIRSKFPFRYAVKMGVAGLRTKPVRLIFTTLLATIAFIVFGVFSTVITFSTAKSGASTLTDSDFQAAVLEKHGLLHVNSDEGGRTLEIDSGVNGGHFSEAEVEAIRRAEPGMNFVPAFSLEALVLDYTGELNDYVSGDSYFGYVTALTAFADASYLASLGSCKLYGDLPSDETECVVSSAVFEAYKLFYREGGISTYEDLYGKPLSIFHTRNEPLESLNISLTIVGVVETGSDFSRYEALKGTREDAGLSMEAWDALEEDFQEVFQWSMDALCWVDDSFAAAHLPENFETYKRRMISNSVNGCVELPTYSGNPYDSAYLLHTADGELAIETQSFGGGRPGWPGGFTVNYYSLDPDAEAEGSYYDYLFAPLLGDRSHRAAALFRYDHVARAADYYYDAPYAFMGSVREGRNTFSRLFAVLGAVAVGLAVFAALLLFNFISASIGAKKKDIGILRAVGARGIDVYQIFMVEGVIITLLCFALGSVLSEIACIAVNAILIAADVFRFKFFLFGWLNALMVFAVAFVTAIFSTSVPVALAVKKKPVEAIRSI